MYLLIHSVNYLGRGTSRITSGSYTYPAQPAKQVRTPPRVQVSTIPTGPHKAGRGGDERGDRATACRDSEGAARITRVEHSLIMETPHGREGRNAALTNVPAPWWKEKKGVADHIGNALLISTTAPVDVRRVVGLYQQRAADATPDAVQLKVASSKKDGAGIRKLELEDALDSTKWRIIPHFIDAEYTIQGDTAQVVDTVEVAGSLTGVCAILTMAGQPPGEKTVYPIQTSLTAWVPEEPAEAERTPAPTEGEEDEGEEPEVAEPNQIEYLALLPT